MLVHVAVLGLLGFASAVDFALTSPEPEPPSVVITAGTYLVGPEIAAGTYRTDGADFCGWYRLSGFSGEMSDTIAVDSVTGPGFVTILPTDLAFEVIGDCSWSLINDLEAPRLVNAEQIMADAGCTNPTPDLEQFGLGTLWDTDWTCTVDGVDVVFTTYADVDQLDLATEAYLEPVVRHVYGLSIVYGDRWTAIAESSASLRGFLPLVTS